MVKEKEVPLKIEVFSDGEDDDFLIHSKPEIQSILQAICQRKTRIALYYDENNRFSLTMIVGVSAEGLWVDPSSRALDNQHIIESKKIVVVTTHNQAKVQFVASDAREDPYGHHEALFIPLPKKLVRLQRRDYFRLSTFPKYMLKCVVSPIQNKQNPAYPMTVMDISVGGVSLICQESNMELLPGHTYPNCRIELPNVGVLNATIQVKNAFEVTSAQGQVQRRAGCVFVNPDGKTTMMLQRYVAEMQREASAAGK
jgi:c-di-GMP-binding flagellar brake protein YcgR